MSASGLETEPLVADSIGTDRLPFPQERFMFENEHRDCRISHAQSSFLQKFKGDCLPIHKVNFLLLSLEMRPLNFIMGFLGFYSPK